MYRNGTADAISAGQRIQSILNAFGDDETEEGMRAELANAIRPFDQPLRANIAETLRRP